MADMTATTMATFLPEVWSRLPSVTYRSNTVLDPLLDHRWEPELGVGMGDTVNIPNFTQNARTDVTKRTTFGTGASLTFNANTELQTQLKVDHMVYDAFRMPVEMSVQRMATYETLLNEGIGEALAQYVDYDIASDNTNGLDVFTAIGTDNVDVTDDTIIAGETVLNNINAKLEGRVFVYSPSTRASMMKIDVLRNSLYAAAAGNLDGKKGPGYQGHIYTLDFYMSNNLEAGTSGKKNAIFQKEAIAIAAQQNVRIVKGLNIADGLFNEIVGYKVYGIKMVKSTFGSEIDGK